MPLIRISCRWNLFYLYLMSGVWYLGFSLPLKCVVSSCKDLKSTLWSVVNRLRMSMTLERDFNKFSKLFERNHSTIREIISKWHRFQMTANLSRSSRSSKFSLRSRRLMWTRNRQVPQTFITGSAGNSCICWCESASMDNQKDIVQILTWVQGVPLKIKKDFTFQNDNEPKHKS